jgi:hypothetical protein
MPPQSTGFAGLCAQKPVKTAKHIRVNETEDHVVAGVNLPLEEIKKLPRYVYDIEGDRYYLLLDATDKSCEFSCLPSKYTKKTSETPASFNWAWLGDREIIKVGK